MLRTQHIQSVSDFKTNYTKTLDRINQTGEAEILTQNGHARAVLLSPKAFDQLMDDVQLTRDVAMIRKAHTQFQQGEARGAEQVFNELRGKLSAMKRGS